MTVTLKRLLALGLVVATSALLAGCVPDTTRGRVQHDIAQTFSNQYAQSLLRQGKPTHRPAIDSIECHSSVNMTLDSGPGGWPCTITYRDPAGAKQQDTFLVLIDSLGCYQAFNVDDKKRYRQVTDVRSHIRIDDPAQSFDGCFDVYDHRTNTSKQ
jgi:hypothetical protein